MGPRRQASAYDRARGICADRWARLRSSSPCYGGLSAVLLRTRSISRRHANLGEQCLALAQRLQDPVLLLQSPPDAGRACFFWENISAARTHLEQGYSSTHPQQHRSLAPHYAMDAWVLACSFAAYRCVDPGLSGPGPAQQPASAHPGPGVVAPLQPGCARCYFAARSVVPP